MLVLIIDDDEELRTNWVKILTHAQHEVIQFKDTISTLNYLHAAGAPDAMLIDHVLPGGPDGLALARQARALYPNTAILMTTLFAGKEDIAAAVRARVDDYLIKPVDPFDLLRRLSEAVVCRQVLYPPQESERELGSLKMDLGARQAFWCGEPLSLTPIEFGILAQLTAKPGYVFNHAEIYALIKGEHIPPAEARIKIKSHMSNLRKKFIERSGTFVVPLRNVRGHGFKWDMNAEREPSDKHDESDE